MKCQIHPSAEVATSNIGDGTRIWQYTVIMKEVMIGQDCNICAHVFVEDGAKIGNRVTIKNGVQIWTGVLLDDDVFIGPNATFTNDIYPRSRQPMKAVTTHVHTGASVGANATILPGVTIGKYALIGAGAVVVDDVPPFSIVAGNPARIIGYICKCGKKLLKKRFSKVLHCSCGEEYYWRHGKIDEKNKIR